MAYTHRYTSKISKGSGKKPIIDANFKVAYSNARQDTDEFGTEMIDESMIKMAIDEVNEKGLPMMLTIDFEDNYNTKLYSIEVPILPACVEHHKGEDMFSMRYACSGSPEKVHELTQDDIANGRYDMEQLTTQQAESIKEYVRRKLAIYYAKQIGNDEFKKQTQIVETYDIMRKKYDLSKIKGAQVQHANLEMIAKCIGKEGLKPEEAIYEFSKVYQAGNRGNGNVCLVHGFGEHIIGLKKGNTPEEIEKIAREDAEAAKKYYELEVSDKGIVFNYNTSKAKGDYPLLVSKQSQPGDE